MKTRIKRRHLFFILLLVLLIAWIALIFSFSFHSGKSSHMESETAVAFISAFLKKAGIHIDHSVYRIYTPFVKAGVKISSDEFIRKTAHFCEYFFLGVICSVCAGYFRKRSKLWPVPLFCALPVSLADELIIQRYFVSGRGSSFNDAVLDCIGFYCAVIVIAIIIAIMYFIRRHRGICCWRH